MKTATPREILEKYGRSIVDLPGAITGTEALKAIESYYQNLYLGRLPEKKQEKFVLGGKLGSWSEEDRQRFYRYGGYDFAISLMESAIRNNGAEK